MPRRLSGVGRALRAGIADRPEHVLDSGGGLVRRDAERRMFAGEFEGADARMRIGPVPHPAVLLAFPDSADLDQNRRRPPFGRSEGCKPSGRNQRQAGLA